MTSSTNLQVVSPYMPNVSEAVRDAQRRVFAQLGIPLEQVALSGSEHGGWLDEHARGTRDGLVAVADIDAFPLSADACARAAAVARRGGLRRLFG